MRSFPASSPDEATGTRNRRFGVNTAAPPDEQPPKWAMRDTNGKFGTAVPPNTLSIADMASISLPTLSEWFYMSRGRPRKEFHDYITDGGGRHVLHQDYVNSPATAFLRYTVEAKDAVNHCQQHFRKNNDGSFSKDALDSLQHILSAFLPAIMGHFETYQRYLFAGYSNAAAYCENSRWISSSKFFVTRRHSRSTL